MCTVVPDFTFLSKLPFRLHLSFLSKKVALCHLPNTPICFIPLSIPSLPLFDFSIQRIVILSFAMSFFLPTLSVAFTSILGCMEVPAPATEKNPSQSSISEQMLYEVTDTKGLRECAVVRDVTKRAYESSSVWSHFSARHVG